MQESTKIHLPTLGQFLIAALGFLGFLSAAIGLVLLGVISLASPAAQGAMQSLPFFSLAWTSGLMSLLMIPSIVFPILRMLGKPVPQWKGRSRLAFGIILAALWVAATTVGSLFENNSLNWAILPPLEIFAIGIPLLAYLAVGRNKLGQSHPQRSWGVVSVSAVITQPLILIVEIVLLAVVVGVGIIWVSSQPDLISEFERLIMRLASAQANPSAIMHILTPYLENPRVVFASVAFTAALVPLIEELLKPLGLWLFLKRGFSPAEGFEMGLISGAVFALSESLTSIATINSGWGALVIGRAGTGLLHMCTTALVGWGLGMAWQEKKYIKLGAAYLAAVTLHSIWNIFGVLVGFTSFFGENSLIFRLGEISPFALGVLMVILFSILVMANVLLRKEQQEKIEPAQMEQVQPIVEETSQINKETKEEI
jgi:hypothetical protein